MIKQQQQQQQQKLLKHSAIKFILLKMNTKCVWESMIRSLLTCPMYMTLMFRIQ